MVAIICLLGTFIADLFKSRRRLEVENLFLRHQLNIILRRPPQRLRLRGSDRALMVWMARLWPSLLALARAVQPATILRWHRAGFRTYWRWKSQGRPGRPRIEHELRDLIRRMSKENPLWGAPRIHGEPEKPKPSYSEERNTKTATVTATPTTTPTPAPIATPMPMLATAAPTPAPSTTPTNTLNGKAATPQREIFVPWLRFFPLTVIVPDTGLTRQYQSIRLFPSSPGGIQLEGARCHRAMCFAETQSPASPAAARAASGHAAA